MSGNQKGVFNADAHQEEVQMLMRGDIKQFHLLKIPLDNVGLVKAVGNDQGMVEVEGNSVVVLPYWLDKEFNLQTSQISANPQLYLKFNHPDAPWLPIAIPSGASALSPCSYTLTFGRFWIYNPTAASGQFLGLCATRAVCMYSNGNIGPVVIGAYQAPTWQSLR